MQWLNSISDWVSSSAGERILLGAIVPFVAIVLSAIVASLIARGGIKRLLRARDREVKAAAVASLVDAARQASTWNSLTPAEQAVADRAATSADITLRLLPTAGASTAATWAAHEIRQFKRASATYSVQFDGPLAEFRDRLLEWQQHPRRARKIFESDLSRWDSELAKENTELQAQQDAWVAQQHAERFAPAAPTAPAAAATTSASVQGTAAPTSAPGVDATPAPVPVAARASAAENPTPGSVEAPETGSYAPVTGALRPRPATSVD